EVNRTPVKSVEDLVQKLEQAKDQNSILLLVQRGTKQHVRRCHTEVAASVSPSVRTPPAGQRPRRGFLLGELEVFGRHHTARVNADAGGHELIGPQGVQVGRVTGRHYAYRVTRCLRRDQANVSLMLSWFSATTATGNRID